MKINDDILHAQSILLPSYQQIEFYLVGCGGTGSWLAPSLCRLARVLNQQGKTVKLVWIDPDRVEPKNVLRQNFCDAEIGSNKAQALALRYSLAWGVAIDAIPHFFTPDAIASDYYSREQRLTMIIGCVDNGAARRSLAEALQQHQQWPANATPSRLWWLDCGNSHSSGQVLLGSHLATNPDIYQFHQLGCIKLPAPSIQHPELLVTLPEEESANNLSCAELAMLDAQSLSINQRIAAEAANYLIQLMTGQLNRMATYLDLDSGSASSTFITEQAIKRAFLTLEINPEIGVI